MALHRIYSLFLLFIVLTHHLQVSSSTSPSSFSTALETLEKLLGQSQNLSNLLFNFYFSQILTQTISFFFLFLVNSYEFQSIDLLRRAMTHPSYSGENFRSLSILGIGAIQSTISLKLLQKDLEVSAKEMNGRIRAISDVDACAAAGSRMGLEKVVRVSAKTNSSAPVVVCGAFRAMFGAVALDGGKLDAAGKVFWRVNGGGFAAVM